MKEGNIPVLGYSYDLWMFSVKATKTKDPIRNLDKLKYTLTEYNQTPFWFPFSDSRGVFYDFVSNANELGGNHFFAKKREEARRVFCRSVEKPRGKSRCSLCKGMR